MGTDSSEPANRQDYWRNYLDEIFEERFGINSMFPAKVDTKPKTGQRNFHKILLKAEIQESIVHTAENCKVSTHSVLLYAWHKVLSVFLYSAQTVVGIEVKVKCSENDQKVILPHLLSHPISSVLTISEMIRMVESRTIELNDIESCDSSNHERMTSTIDNIFLLNNDDQTVGKNCPLTVRATQSRDALALTVEYDMNMFNPEEIRRLTTTFEVVVQQIVQNPSKVENELYFIDQDEFQRHEDTEIKVELSHSTYLEIFREQLGKSPDKVALIYENTKLTYKELDKKSNQVANFVRKNLCVEKEHQESIIPLSLERNELLIIAMLGIMKAGAAFLPLNSTLPKERIKYILNDVQPKLVLTSGSNSEKLINICQQMESKCRVYNLENCNLNDKSSELPAINICSDSIYLLLYTSGTTGQAKGVVIEHRNLVNTCMDFPRRYDLEDTDVILALHSHTFSAFIYT